MAKTDYVPALRFDFLTRFYDPLVRLSTREIAFKKALIKQAALAENHRILDLACGTGTLLIAIKKRFPRIEAVGYDVDAEILDLARRKAKNAGVQITFKQGFSHKLSFENETFDRVFSTLAFHHLNLERKNETLREIRRVLKPHGEFHLADFALPKNKSQFLLSKWIRLIDGHETTRDNLRGKLIGLMEENGFQNVRRTKYFKTMIGTIRLFRATKTN